jgi:hypothetical protein
MEKELLLMWDQAGERPFELFQEIGKADILLNILRKSYNINKSIYRCSVFIFCFAKM